MAKSRKTASKRVTRPAASAPGITAKTASKTTNSSPAPNISAKPQFKDIDEIQSTADIPVSDRLIDQVVGQEKGIEIIRKAAQQKRNVLLIGTPGTGKSMLAQAMAELLEVSELKDTLVTTNPDDDNTPKVKTMKAGEGRKIIQQERARTRMAGGNMNTMIMVVLAFSLSISLFVLPAYFDKIIVAAIIIGITVFVGIFMFAAQVGRGRMMEVETAKLIVDNTGKEKAPFIDATGSRAGALLGDVKHDPFQSFHGKTTFELNGRERNMEEVWSKLAAKYPDLVSRNESGYEGMVVPSKEKLYTKGAKQGKTVKSRVYIVNRRPYAGHLVKITTKAGRTLATTPEHAYILNDESRSARSLRKGKAVKVLHN